MSNERPRNDRENHFTAIVAASVNLLEEEIGVITITKLNGKFHIAFTYGSPFERLEEKKDEESAK